MTDLSEDSAVCESYTLEVTSGGLDRLLAEPSLLRHELSKCERSLEERRLKQVAVAVQSTERLSECLVRLDTMAQSLTGLHSSTPLKASLSSSATFRQLACISQRRANNRKLAAEHLKIMEVLELPLLTWKCARSGLYEEAADLYLLARDLFDSHTTKARMPLSVLTEMEECCQLLRDAILSKLGASLSLSECVRLVSVLRRLPQYATGGRLKRDFLNARTAKLGGGVVSFARLVSSKKAETQSAAIGSVSVEQLTSAECYSRCKQLVESTKQSVFEVVIEYRALFKKCGDGLEESGFETEDDFVLQLWLAAVSQSVSGALKRWLPGVNNGSYLCLLMRCAEHCSQSLATVGCRSLLLRPCVPLLTARVSELFAENCAKAPLYLDYTLPIAADSLEASDAKPSIVKFPPLCVMASAIGSALNALRECPLRSTVFDCRNTLVHCVALCTDILLRHSSLSASAATRPRMRQMVAFLADDILPAICDAFNRIFDLKPANSVISLENDLLPLLAALQ